MPRNALPALACHRVGTRTSTLIATSADRRWEACILQVARRTSFSSRAPRQRLTTNVTRELSRACMCAAPENKTWFAGSSLAVGTYSIAPSPAASTATATPPPNRNAASTATAAAASSPTASAASAAPAASPVSRKLYGGFGCSNIFLVKYIERRQADIGNFLFTESYF